MTDSPNVNILQPSAEEIPVREIIKAKDRFEAQTGKKADPLAMLNGDGRYE